MYNAEQIANWFLVRDSKNIDSEGISNLKLQKLLYYAQSASLAMCDKLLFSDGFQAWKHGPVIEELYRKYKDFSYLPIPVPDDYEISDADTEVTQLLEDVYVYFSQFSAWKLSEMTHNEEPWKDTESGDMIDTAIMKKSFSDNYLEQTED
jgi:uncharacterized phage-associated protein